MKWKLVLLLAIFSLPVSAKKNSGEPAPKSAKNPGPPDPRINSDLKLKVDTSLPTQPNLSYEDASALNHHSSECPKLKKYSKLLDNRFTGEGSEDLPADCHKITDDPRSFNSITLDVAASTRPQGGYAYEGPKAFPLNVPISYPRLTSGTSIITPEEVAGKNSDCSGGPTLTFLKGLGRISDPPVLDKAMLDLKGPLFSVLKNGKTQMGSIYEQLKEHQMGDFGEHWGSYEGKTPQEVLGPGGPACPGDYLNFSRALWPQAQRIERKYKPFIDARATKAAELEKLKSAFLAPLGKGSKQIAKLQKELDDLDKKIAERDGEMKKYNKKGHSAIYLGSEDGYVYWWSSNEASHGWGVDCTKIEWINKDDFSVTRIKKPERIAEFLRWGLYAPVVDKGDSGRFQSTRETTQRSLDEWEKSLKENEMRILHHGF